MLCRNKPGRNTPLIFLIVVAACLFAGGVNDAVAVPITGNQAELTLWSNDMVVRNNNLSLNPTGTAEMNGTDSFGRPLIVFPITGGDTESASGGASIQFNGSGLGFGRNGSTLLLDDFVVDTGANTLSGDVTIERPGQNPVVMEDVALFNDNECKGFTFFRFNPTGSDVFTQAFGTRDLNGELFGFASVDIRTQGGAVPEPGTLLLLGAGILGLLGFRRIS